MIVKFIPIDLNETTEAPAPVKCVARDIECCHNHV